ncbi:site-specific DNA-methyltransferase [Microlunatus capsulatus]|uniref:Adenine-specific DNA-methyltransferase n=1 Tax=Microlunatus capsulatus TaxID=99117 RepID=A0ABS4Z7A6_9ACTN|nr:site-specific DNA-methyltransferase [Microlunatus capsulatus]MBP2416886.1 adenine-specific DNA-methyltransferase [Microlunatus capsulatus]
MSRLNDLLRQLRLKDPALAADLQREVDALVDRRAFGLNFERHVPEAVELPGRKVRRGDKVRILPLRGSMPTTADRRLWRVGRLSSGKASLEAMDGEDPRDTAMSSVDDLVVVAEFRDPIYPGLISNGKVERGGDEPFHIVINAENYHALQTLLFTHRGKIDCIYIDPPYNTGNEGWIYNDRYVADDDHYKHSKWLAFMERRLLLARELLKDTGVLIVAIGDDEHHRLRSLLDQIFGTSNFLANVAWEGVRKNDSRYVSSSIDYMLMYAKSADGLTAHNVRWREPKPGVSEVVRQGGLAWQAAIDLGKVGPEASAIAQNQLRRWWKSIPSDHPAKSNPGLAIYDRVEHLPGREGWVYRTLPLSSPNPRANLMYEVMHPSGSPCKMPPNGWRWSRDVMSERIASGDVLFGATSESGVQYKRYLTSDDSQAVSPVFNQDRAAASSRLTSILGERRFPYPKDHTVLMRWFNIVAPQDALILDFFGGSGSTSEAVIRLNAEDGGARQCLLVTNNEIPSTDAKTLAKAGYREGDQEWEKLGVHDYVAKPRIIAVVDGERPDGSKYQDTVAANIEFFTLTYEAPLRVASHREFERIAPLLWLRAGSVGRRINDIKAGWDVAETYGVLANLDQVEAFLHALKEQEAATLVFVVTDENRLFESVCRDLPDHVEPVRLYESYLRNFEIESGRGAR